MGSGIFTVIVVVAVLAGVVMLLALLSKADDTSSADAKGVRVVGYFSLATAVLIGGVALVQIITTLVPGSTIDITIPVEPLPVQPDVGVEILSKPDAHMEHGVFTQVLATTSDLSMGTRIWSAVGILLLAVVPVTLGIVIWIVCRRLLAGAPFAESVTRISVAAAVIVLIAGLTGQIATGIAMSSASDELLSVGGWLNVDDNGNEMSTTGLPLPTFGINIEMWPIAIAFVLGVFATIVQFGSRVQRERDSLAAETARLRRDTDGLV